MFTLDRIRKISDKLICVAQEKREINRGIKSKQWNTFTQRIFGFQKEKKNNLLRWLKCSVFLCEADYQFAKFEK